VSGQISEGYQALQRQMHADPEYGKAATMYAPLVKQVIDQFRIATVFDYGAGKRRLKEALDSLGAEIEYRAYDPAFPEYGEPQPAELVCCIDVLEHVEPDRLDAVLDELRRITIKRGFFTVHTGPAKKFLPDGRNAHLIQEPASWWLPRLCARFEIDHLSKQGAGFLVVTSPLAA
jgi:hypothetical protein